MGSGDRQPQPIRRLRPWGVCTGSIACASIAALLSSARASANRVPESVAQRLRPVRVLLVADADEVRVRGAGPLSLGGPAGALPADTKALSLTHDGAGGLLLGGNAVSQPLAVDSADSVFLSVRGKDGIAAESEYPGTFRVFADAEGVNVINEVPVEDYVGCVVANEVWPTFQTESYRAQAIISRTFVLYQMDRRPNASIDVTATQGSQVYHGIRRDEPGRRATEAAEYTRGIVLTYTADDGRQKLFCTYFSAACGGRSQSAAFLGPESDVPPLRGGVECDYCKIAPGDTYRWGPLTLPADEVLSRLAARYPDASRLGTLTAIEAGEQTDAGRTVTLRLAGSGGGFYELLAERFRLAVDPMRIRSTHFTVRLVGGNVIFEDGRGFGHGMGLCQWGMEGQAREGRSASQILQYYYPGSHITRAY